MVLRLWFESARAMFFLFILLDALPVPLLRQVSVSVFFSVFFQLRFWRLLFYFIKFLGAFGGPRGVILGTICKNKCYLREKVAPSFLHTIIAFWLDVEGLGPPGEFKKREKTTPGKSCFFGLKRKVPKSVFHDSRVILGVHFGAL